MVSALPDLVDCVMEQATAQTDDYDDQAWAFLSLLSNASEKSKTDIESHLLNHVLPHLPEDNHAGIYLQLGGDENLAKAASLVEKITDPYQKAGTLVQLDRIEDAYRAARGIDSPWQKSLILRALLSKKDVFQEFLNTAEQIEEDFWKANTLGYAVGNLPEEDRPRILDRVLSLIPNIKSPRPRIQAMMSLYKVLPEDQQQKFQQEIMAMMRQLINEYSIHGLMQYVGRAFEGEGRAELIAMAENLNDPLYRARSMFIFLPDTDANNIKRDIVTYLNSLSNRTRGQVISLFARREILSPELWGQEIVDQTIHVVIEQCRN